MSASPVAICIRHVRGVPAREARGDFLGVRQLARFAFALELELELFQLVAQARRVASGPGGR